MIELKDFISETLVGILQGVQDARAKLPDEASKISPLGRFEPAPGSNSVLYHVPELGSRIGLVDFDIAITTEDKNSETVTGKAGAKVVVLSADLQANKHNDQSYQNISRVKFSVPLDLADSTALKALRGK